MPAHPWPHLGPLGFKSGRCCGAHRVGTMPRFTVHVRGEWLAVPCTDPQLPVGWLGREAIRRYAKNKPDNGGFASADDVRFLVRRCKGLGLLDNEDPVGLALEDNEFVEVGEWPAGEPPRAHGAGTRKAGPMRPAWAQAWGPG